LAGWGGLAYYTAQIPPSESAIVLSLPILWLAVSSTVALPIWLVASRLRIPGTGQRPALALRMGAWVGLWAAACAALQFSGIFSWATGVALAVVVGLLESFLIQWGRERGVYGLRRLRR
jgi:hypothetical protein